jgi:hypothetical protein
LDYRPQLRLCPHQCGVQKLSLFSPQ